MPVPGGPAQRVARSSAGHCSIGNVFRRLLIITGLAALAAYLLRRRPGTQAAPADVDPAQALRRKLDETRSRDEAGAEPELSEDLDARRREVHERARASADEMRGSSSD